MNQRFAQTDIHLYSLLKARVQALGHCSASPEQWIGRIMNLQREGVSSREIDWTRVIQHLRSLEGSRVKASDIVEFLVDRPACDLVCYREVTDEFRPTVRFEKAAMRPDQLRSRVSKNCREVRALQFVDRVFGLQVWGHVDVDDGLFGRHRYWSIKFPSGKRHPLSGLNAKVFATPREAMQFGRQQIAAMADRLRREGFVSSLRIQNHYAPYSLNSGENYSEWLLIAPNLPVQHWNPHFDASNLIAHLRTSEHCIDAGARLFMVEEVQSDWNQELRDAEGDSGENADFGLRYRVEPEIPDNPYRKHWVDTALRAALLLAARTEASYLGILPGRFHRARYPWAHKRGLALFYDQVVAAALRRLSKPWDAKIEEITLQTLTRTNFVSQRKDGSWSVCRNDSGASIADEFASFADAEEFRQSAESWTCESIPAMSLTTEMLGDLQKSGLPYLGAIGHRNV